MQLSKSLKWRSIATLCLTATRAILTGNDSHGWLAQCCPYNRHPCGIMACALMSSQHLNTDAPRRVHT
jgi:hypothetical protein